MNAFRPFCVGLALTAVAALAAAPDVASADVLIYEPIDGLKFTLQGKVDVNPGKTVSFHHKKLGEKLTFALEDIKRYEAETLDQQFGRRVGKAGKDPTKLYAAALWALRHGQLNRFYEAIDKVLVADPKHKDANRIKALKAEIDRPLPESDNVRLEAELRKFCPMKSMKIATSKHFILLHDTPLKPKKTKGKKDLLGGKFVPRSTIRLELLERVYESFLLTFFSRGIEGLEVPKERMMVVLFKEEQDFRTFSVQQDASLVHAAGYWNPMNNISVFYDNSNSKDMQTLAKESEEIAKLGKDEGSKRLIRFGKAIKVFYRILQEEQDIRVVSHEATHQVAGNTGLFPRTVMTPRWMHEGLAAYFECQNDADWAGIGAVNEERLTVIKSIMNDPHLESLEFIIGDDFFQRAGNQATVVMAYGGAWSLTHFMMNRHLQEFIEFYRKLGEMPPETLLTKHVIINLFKSVIPDIKNLRVEWASYIDSLRTDMDLIINGEGTDEEEEEE